MKNFQSILLAFLILTTFSSAHEGPWTASRPDGHAPISVMGDHMHAMGEWMLSYRYMTMEMEGLLKGTDSVSASDQLVGMVTMIPTSMTMDMHMLGLMHAVSEKWTLMGMINYLDNEMSMLMKNGMMTMPMYSKTSGLGDLKVGGLYDLAHWDNGRRIHVNLGFSGPTGSINEKSNGNVVGYGMQLGSGTWDFNPAITFLGQTEDYSWGAQVGGIIRIGDNDQDYSLGNRLEAALWGARKITDSLSTSAKFDYSSQSAVDGFDSRMMSMMSPSLSPASQGRDLTTFGLGLNYYFHGVDLKGHRIAAEWETPISQNVNGVQLELDSTWTLGWQYAW